MKPGAFKTILFATIMTVGGIGAPAVQAQSLADAFVAAYRNSNLLEQNRATLRAADEDVASAMATLRPVLSWAATANARSVNGIDSSSAALELSAQMTLYDFGRREIGMEIAKESVLATRSALVSVEQDVLLAAVRAYTGVKSATEKVAINQNSVRVIGEEFRAANDRFEVGEVTRTDVALAEARLAATRASLAAAEGQLAVARESYKAATGAYPGALAALPAAPRLPATQNEARTIAERSHPAIVQAKHQVAIAELQVKAAATERLPTVGGSVRLSTDDSGTDSASVSLSMQQTLYAGGRLSASHRKALAGSDRARAALMQTGAIISQNVGVSWANIEVARAQIRAIEQQIAAATVAYRGVREEAMLGARTTLDVLDAEQNLLNAQASKIEAEANLQVALYSLLSAMGLLTVEHLNLGIPTYDPAAYYEAVRNAPRTSVQGESLDRVLRAIGKN